MRKQEVIAVLEYGKKQNYETVSQISDLEINKILRELNNQN